MAFINDNRLALALILSGLVHGLLLFHYVTDEVVTDESESQSAVVQVELMPHVFTPPASKILKPAVVHHEVMADAMIESDQVADVAPAEDIVEQREQVALVRNSNHEQFVSLLHQAIDKHKRYPYQAQRQRREGMVKLQFVVHPDGHVTDVSVVESSRFDVLDEAARKAVNAISPFQLAANFIYEQHMYDVDIDFRLN